ncbi:hypothetical protein GIB67_016481 [Kingdonia uniflora]|uniref:Uncharacterized protein n=1 Tax=Kingdonia uniflora TaxID=39325 RepID=A0A7J7M806_9MAGN|nr:hypothetical protein GIB67_016481 [Kingdonia uniflora]
MAYHSIPGLWSGSGRVQVLGLVVSELCLEGEDIACSLNVGLEFYITSDGIDDVKIIYKSGMVMAGADASDCIAVDDSLHHDIKGANIAGIESTFITGGIHATELGLSSFEEFVKSSSVQDLTSKYDAYPS